MTISPSEDIRARKAVEYIGRACANGEHHFCDATACTCICHHHYKPPLISKSALIYDTQEARALYRTLKYHYIDYEDQEAHAAINKLMKFLRQNNELD